MKHFCKWKYASVTKGCKGLFMNFPLHPVYGHTFHHLRSNLRYLIFLFIYLFYFFDFIPKFGLADISRMFEKLYILESSGKLDLPAKVNPG